MTKNKQAHFKKLTILLGIAIFVTIFAMGARSTATNADFCVKCHMEKPYYYTWKASSHSNVSCVKCHEGPGPVNFFLDKGRVAKNTYLFLTKKYKLPLSMRKDIPNEVCMECHSLYRELTPSGDLIIPHKTHYQKKILCITCHPGVAHGLLSSRMKNVTDDMVKGFSAADGREIVKAKLPTGVTMFACMKCHDKRDGPLACDACHSSPKKPKTHGAESFALHHGDLARQDLESCDLCHGFYKTKNGILNNVTLLPGEKLDRISLYARRNTFCVECHSNMPQSHEVDLWDEAHGEGKDTAKCLTCHAKDFCIDCHTFLPFTHEKRDWPITHGKDKNTANCQFCHTTIPERTPVVDPCDTCHLKEPHRDVRKIDHSYHNNPPPPIEQDCSDCHDGCLTCHSGKTCTPCHKGPITTHRESRTAQQTKPRP